MLYLFHCCVCHLALHTLYFSLIHWRSNSVSCKGRCVPLKVLRAKRVASRRYFAYPFPRTLPRIGTTQRDLAEPCSALPSNWRLPQPGWPPARAVPALSAALSSRARSTPLQAVLLPFWHGVAAPCLGMQVWVTAFMGRGGYQPAGQRLRQASLFCCSLGMTGSIAVADPCYGCRQLGGCVRPRQNRLCAAGEVKLQPDGGVKEIDPEVAGIIKKEKDRQASAGPPLAGPATIIARRGTSLHLV